MPTDNAATLKNQDGAESVDNTKTDEDLKEELIIFDEEAEDDAQDTAPEFVPNPNDVKRAELVARFEENAPELYGLEEQKDDEEEKKTEQEVLKKEDKKSLEDDALVEIIVKGEKKKVPQSELVKAYQIDSLRLSRLQEVTELKKELEEKLKVSETAQTLKVKPDEAEEDKVKAKSDLDYAELVKTIREGEDKEAEEALRQLAEQSITKGSEVDVETLVDKKLREKELLQEEAQRHLIDQEADSARTKFEVTYLTEMNNHPDFWSLAVMEDGKLQTDEDWASKSLEERFLEAGERAKKWFKDIGADISEEDSSQDAAENKIKGKSTQVIRGKSVRASLGEDDEPDPTASDIIKEIAKSRGQTHLQ